MNPDDDREERFSMPLLSVKIRMAGEACCSLVGKGKGLEVEAGEEKSRHEDV